MAQPPFLVDQLQIAPGSGDTLIVSRDTDGSLLFRDASNLTGLKLSQLANLSTITNVLTVGPAGAGAQYTVIQDALDDIPIGASPSNPYTVLIMAGAYTETLTLVRNGVSLVALGAVSIQQVGATDTLTVTTGLGSTPQRMVASGITFVNSNALHACVRLIGGAGSTLGSDYIAFHDCTFQATADNRPIWATEMNTLVVRGGSFAGSSGLSLAITEQCNTVLFQDMSYLTLDNTWDSGGTLPLHNSNPHYSLFHCPFIGSGSGLAAPVSSVVNAVAGLGTFEIIGGSSAAVAFGGNATVALKHVGVGNLTLNNTVSCTRVFGTRGTATCAVGTTLTESVLRGEVAFAVDTAKTITFVAPQGDDGFTVSLEMQGAPANSNAPWVTAKSEAGFTINFADAQTMTVGWTAIRP